MADSATIPTHLDTPEIATYMSSNALDDLFAADPSGPVAVDERGRSAQTFLVEVVARSGDAVEVRSGARSFALPASAARWIWVEPRDAAATVRANGG